MDLKALKRRKEDIEKNEMKYTDDPENIAKLVKEEDLQKSKKFIEDLETWVALNSKEPLILSESSSFFRKHMYDVLKKDFSSLVYETVPKKDSYDKEIHVYKFVDENEKKLYFDKKAKEKEEYFLSQIGFTSIIQLLLECKKPIIGHNCYFDLMFLYSHFIELLPYKYSIFKKNLTKYFPE